jgi:hypothetical protein
MPTADGAYVGVDMPFVAGQDESYDRKLLPVGPLRRVDNAFQERTGRWTERRGETERAHVTLENTDISDHLAKSTLPEDRVSLLYRGNARVAYFGNTLADEEFVRVVSGEYGGFGYLGQWFASGYPSSKTDAMTFSPTVACTDRHIVFAFLSTSKVIDAPAQPFHINVLWYDINTLRIVRIDNWQTLPASTALEVKLAASKDGSVYLGLNSRTVGGTIGLYQWSSPTAVRAERSILPARPYATFDMAPADTGVWICYCTDANVVTLGRYVGTAFVFSVAQALTTAPAPSTRVVYCSAAAQGDANAVGIGATNGVAGQHARLRVYNGTPLAGYFTSISGDSAIYPGFMPDGDVTLFWGAIKEVSNVNLAPGSVAFDATPVVVDYNSFVVGHPIISNDAMGKGFDARGYVPIVGVGVHKPYLLNLLGAPVVTPGETAGYARIQSAAQALVRFNDDATNVPLAVGGMIMRAGAMMLERVSSSTSTYNALVGVPKTTGARAVQCGNKYWAVPGEQNLFPSGQDDSFQANASFVLLENERTIGAIFGVAWDRNNVLTAGPALHGVDDQTLFFAGFSDRPTIDHTVVNGGAGAVTGSWQFIAVAEYRDAAGRLWRSAPSLPVTASQDASTHFEFRLRPPSGYPMGTRMVLYRAESQAGSSIFYQHSSYPVNGLLIIDTVPDVDLVRGEPIYTAGGVLENSAPPAARFVARTRDRVWAGLLDYTARVQSSKFIRPTEGVHWCNSDQFFVDIPQAVTGLATMDDVLVVFCEDSIYLVHGDGPSDLGVGAYSPPQRIPSDVGCVEGRSIVTDANGVYFMSRRGLEIMSRGFSAPVFIGDQVRDLVEAHPFCLDAQNYQADKTVRWLLSDTNGFGQELANQVILVFDTRTGAWSTYECDELIGIGKATGAGPDSVSHAYPADGMTAYAFNLNELVATREALTADGTRWQTAWETGEMRPAGLLAGALGRRLIVLGTYGGPVDITLRMAFDDKRDWHPTWIKTWRLGGLGYAKGDPVTLELTLPQQKFQAVRFRIEAQRTTEARPGFDAHGMTVYFDTEGAGPRRSLGRAQKG